MASESQRKAIKRYHLKTVSLLLRFRRDADADVIQKLNDVPNKTGYVRELVRDDICKTQQSQGGQR